MSTPRRTIKPSVKTGSVSRQAVVNAVRAVNANLSRSGGEVRGKAYVIDALSTRARLSRADAESVVNALFSSKRGIIAEALRRGDRVVIDGFGTFELRKNTSPATSDSVRSNRRAVTGANSPTTFIPKGKLADIAQ